MDEVTSSIIRELLTPLDPKFLGPHKFIYCYLPLEEVCPAKEFLNSLRKEAQASYAKHFEYHCQGLHLRGDKWKHFEDGIYEYKDNPSKSRLMHIHERSNLIVLLFGFTGKKEDKVEQIHVNRAHRMYAEYKTRVETIRKRTKR